MPSVSTPRRGNAVHSEEVVRGVRRIARALALSSRDLARRHGLTAPQLMCLRMLQDGGKHSAGTLAAALSLSPQTITGLTDRLQARALIRRARSDVDRRQVLISLTAAGRRLLAQASPPLQDRFVARLDALPAQRRKALREALDTVVTLLEADALDAAPLLADGPTLAPAMAAKRHGSAARRSRSTGGSQ